MPISDSPSLDRLHPSSSGDAEALSRLRPSKQASGKEMWLLLGFIGFALGLLYAPVFDDLWHLWMSREDYSHGFLVPLISLYLMKGRAEELRHTRIKPGPVLGLGLILVALAGFFIGVAGGVITLSSSSLIGLLAGLTLYLFGYPYLRVLALPFAYLIFMTPVLDIVVEPLHHPLQLLGATVVSAVFGIAGVPTYLDGIFIHFPNGVLEVAVQCSGAGYLVSILAIGLPLASLALHTWRARVTLILAGLGISIVGNWARIALIGTIGYLSGWGPQVHGPLHILQGMLVYWIGFGALFTGAWILAKAERRAMKPSYRPPMDHLPPVIQPAWQRWRRIWWVALATLTAAVVYLHGYDRGPVAAKQSLISFPTSFGEWAVLEASQASPVVRIAGADQELMKVYRKPGGAALRLYIAYFNAQTQDRELVNYLTAPLHQDTTATVITIGEQSHPMNIGFYKNHETNVPIVFWYAFDGRSIADRYEAKWATIVHALAREGSNGALVVISGDSAGNGQSERFDYMRAFAEDLIPVLGSYLP
jgi:EpsI family protein